MRTSNLRMIFFTQSGKLKLFQRLFQRRRFLLFCDSRWRMVEGGFHRISPTRCVEDEDGGTPSFVFFEFPVVFDKKQDESGLNLGQIFEVQIFL